MEISIEVDIQSNIKRVWSAWTTPEEITLWNFASNDWCCPNAEIELTEGGSFNYRMEAKDSSIGFDFEGKFTKITPEKLIQYSMDDGRNVSVTFIETESGVKVIETFESEDIHTVEQQRLGWLAILNNFKSHVERTSN